jgi:hypothetical protein
MSTDQAAPPIESPADQPFGREYINAMNKAEQAGESPALEPAGDPVVDPTADTVEIPVEAPKDAAKPAERDETGKFKPRDNPVVRMQQATAEAARLKAENAELRARVEARERPEPSPVEAPRHVVPAPDAPKLEDFLDQPDPYAALATATARHEVTRILAHERAQVEAQKVNDANAARFSKAMADDDELPGLMEAADAALVQAGADPRAPFPAVMLEAIKASESGPSIARFLGSHPGELVQLAREVRNLPPSREAATVVRLMLEAQVKASIPVPAAASPSASASALPRPSAVPIRALRTSREPAPVADPSELPFGREYVQKMNARERSGA